MKNISDEYVRSVLGRVGEQPLPGNTSRRWGMVRQLNGTQQRVATFVSTPVFEFPTPLAVSLSFSLDGQTFSPVVPAIGNNSVVVDLIRGIDPQSGPVTDRHELEEGDSQAFCAVMAQSLQVVVRLDGEPPESLFVGVVVAAVSSLSCEQIVPVPPVAPTPAGFATATIARFAALTAAPTVILPNPARALFSISNQSAANLYVALAGTVNITAGSEFASVVIPGNVSGGYSVENYRGPIAFQFDADDATGYAIKTEGLYS